MKTLSLANQRRKILVHLLDLWHIYRHLESSQSHTSFYHSENHLRDLKYTRGWKKLLLLQNCSKRFGPSLLEINQGILYKAYLDPDPNLQKERNLDLMLFLCNNFLHGLKFPLCQI